MNIESVKERIASLEAAGELSIKESFYLEAMKELCESQAQVKQLAALAEENSIMRKLLPDYISVPATDNFLASLRAEGAANAIPVGYVLMPEQIHLDADAVECICSQGGDGGYNYGDFTDVILWVGEVESDDGSKTHGLNVSSADYPEDGAINLYEFAAQLRSKSEVQS
ncbi:hypothetical protein HLI26_07310 [Salmonella enterica subsp. enterica]|uniref:hypothetical protein n=1 Tax=Salmonella enterica TaxID=28901 RepID=UPI00215171BF|nr:hypothetical protein [Salmonella enterica]MCR6026788.1 hypothetical protein [Salmonella enterica subsp. enterica]